MTGVWLAWVCLSFVLGFIAGRIIGIGEAHDGPTRVFVLHDDGEPDELPAEADKKNAALHEFLHGAQIQEWEGSPHTKSGSGINVWIEADAGDYIYRYPDDSVRVVRRKADG